ncbi:hypothetical protein EVAR_31006_1 [Eumeta japonica]|uniref:Uncharacterized protein n=1 Tax=Eumeta variegata TaxID=151549 RepID=A0A4C1VCY3_EUMVA|nr:hypothetical protein EVAR_31006_1 [Eumeta japonica]
MFLTRQTDGQRAFLLLYKVYNVTCWIANITSDILRRRVRAGGRPVLAGVGVSWGRWTGGARGVVVRRPRLRDSAMKLGLQPLHAGSVRVVNCHKCTILAHCGLWTATNAPFWFSVGCELLQMLHADLVWVVNCHKCSMLTQCGL